LLRIKQRLSFVVACALAATLLAGCLLPTASPLSGRRFAVLIRGGQVIDGTGAPAVQADVGIDGDRIVAVGDLSRCDGEQVIEAAGLIIAPGFINAHSHTDENYQANRQAGSALLQGITTEIGGQDGRSPLDLDAFFKQMTQRGCGVNLAMLVGQGSIRTSVAGNDSDVPTATEMTRMQDRLRSAMEAGALGLSTGLEYTPGKNTGTSELAELARAMAPYDGVYVSHMRNEGTKVVAAVAEALSIGEQAGVRVALSHLKVLGASMAGQSAEVIAQVSSARQRGQQVMADVYPYQTPDYAQNLALSAVRNAYPAERIIIRRCAEAQYREQSLAQIAGSLGVTPQEAAQRILAVDGDTRVYIELEATEDLIAFMQADFTMFCNDASAKPRYSTATQHLIHPRTHGAFPRILGHWVRDNHVLSLPAAIHKATAQAADYYHLKDRGRVAAGCLADLVIFSADEIEDNATFASPQEPPSGIKHVFVNGRQAVADGKLTEVLAGRPLRRGQ
jgi:N-acyl-D-aspartate/D-glutamate deacylase